MTACLFNGLGQVRYVFVALLLAPLPFGIRKFTFLTFVGDAYYFQQARVSLAVICALFIHLPRWAGQMRGWDFVSQRVAGEVTYRMGA